MLEVFQNIQVIVMKKYLAILIVLFLIVALFFILHKNFMQYNPIVSVVNTRWQKIHIQVRAGDKPNPLSNKLIFDQCLTRGQSRSFTVDNGDNIIYRRDRDPNHADSVHFTNWIVAKCDNSSTFILNNP
ncbi:MAG TPA: hypothetical protein VFE54_13845 [Mucilaginibacter sp.]|jgi:hypothetical protein|nr:hypothetical protein [Mucilaginibacter sp.]